MHSPSFSLLALALILYCSKSWESLLQAMDSGIHARLALEVTRTGWIPALPMAEMNLDSPRAFFNDQPFLFFFINGKFMRLISDLFYEGVWTDAWSARLLPSLMGVASIGLLVKFGKQVIGQAQSTAAALLILLCPLVIQFTARFQLDPPMIFFILLSFFLWDRKRPVLAGLSAGIAVSMKSPIGFLILPAALTHLLIFKTGFRRFLLLGCATLLPPLLMWALANRIANQNLFLDWVSNQVFRTAIEGRGVGTGTDFTGGVKLLLRNLAPGLVALTVGLLYLRAKIRFDRTRLERSSLFLIGGVFVYLAVSAMSFRFPHYYLPMLPLFAIGLAGMFSIEVPESGRSNRAPAILLSVVMFTSLLLNVMPIPTTFEFFPGLRRIIPFIQKDSLKTESILFVEHTQPYGSSGDYFCTLVFYTGNRFASARCKEAEDKVLKYQPEWIVIHGNPSDCIPPGTLSKYRESVSYRGERLLRRQPAPGSKAASAIDLGPLENELRARI
jgi:hypothetical protein